METIKSLKAKKDESSIQDESLLLDKQLQLQELETEKLKLQMKYQEEERKELEEERKEHELEPPREREREQERVKEREHELAVLRLKQGVREEHFNVSSTMKLVPVFDEKNVAEFFVAFEKIANKLVWPKPMWTTLLQCRLVGKAQKVYVTLKEELSSDYDSVKEIVLKAYKLVPEAYGQKFC